MSDDLISRQAAIDAFEDTTFTKNKIQRRLSELPSAQPEGCPFFIGNTHDRGDDSLCGLFRCEVKDLAIGTRMEADDDQSE